MVEIEVTQATHSTQIGHMAGDIENEKLTREKTNIILFKKLDTLFKLVYIGVGGVMALELFILIVQAVKP